MSPNRGGSRFTERRISRRAKKRVIEGSILTPRPDTETYKKFKYFRWNLKHTTLIFLFVIGSILWLNRFDNSVDRVWSDLMTSSQKVPTSGQYIAVNITGSDLTSSSSRSAFRQILAERVNSLHAAGAKRVLFDLFLPTGKQITSGDIALAKALSYFGRDKVAFGKTSDNTLSAPQVLLNSATMIDLNLLGDNDGYFRNIRLQTSSRLGNPAIWLVDGSSDHRSTAIDLRLNPDSIPTYSLTSIARPEVLKQLKGKTVIFGVERLVSRSRASLPNYGFIDRSRFLALSAESYAGGSVERFRFGAIIGTVLALASLCGGLVIGGRIRSVRSGLVMLMILSLPVIGFCLWINIKLGAPAYPSTLLVIGSSGMMAALAHRLRLTELLAGLFAGDLSPEEAWLWRCHVDQERPVLIFGADGSLRRSNQAAIAAFKLDVQKKSERTFQLTQQCMPGIGIRAENLTISDPVLTKFRLEWPHNSIPLAVFFDVTDQVAREEKLNSRLMTDPLTGLKNRHGFDTALQAIDLEGGAAFAIFYLDMNGFKHVNDTLGHDAGDELLTVAARRFSSVVRDGDVVARLGGDEFGICLHGSITPAHAQVVVDELKSSLSSPIRIKKGEVSVGVAVGFSIRIPTDTSTDEVVQRADAAMYQNKKASSELPPVGDPVLILARTN